MRFYGIVAVVLIVLGGLVCLANQPTSQPATQPAAQPATFTIATYNINFGNADLKTVIKTIEKSQADLVCLQETNNASAAYFKKHMKKLYPHMRFASGPGAGGFGLLSKAPLFRLKYIPKKFGLFGALVAEVNLGGRRVQIANIHLQPVIPPRNANTLKLLEVAIRTEKIRDKEIRHIHRHLSDKLPVLVMGDFNSTTSLKAPTFLRKNGFIDSFASVTPVADSHITWRTKHNGKIWEYRIDHIYHSSEAETAESKIIESNASDHFLVVSTLKWKPAKAATTQPSEAAHR